MLKKEPNLIMFDCPPYFAQVNDNTLFPELNMKKFYTITRVNHYSNQKKEFYIMETKQWYNATYFIVFLQIFPN